MDPSRDTHTSWTAVSLPCSRFRTVRGPWEKAVGDLARYIDQVLASGA